MKIIIALSCFAVLLFSSSCNKDFSTNGVQQIIKLEVDDPLGKRADEFKLIDVSSSYFAADSQITHLTITADDTTILKQQTLIRYSALDFDHRAYDLIILTLPDPGHAARLIKNVYRDKQRYLEFGIYDVSNGRPVPMVVISSCFLFQFSR
ncbi:MAG: hypothetical protein EHM72_02410 [Calditrichaeota bacterium]|nr:MAG: hypothetical protein EHM72_02410 [Calditrichota bacterium]